MLSTCSSYFRAAYDEFWSQPGRDLSFTDSALLTVAHARKVENIATFDRDFEDARAGFRSIEASGS